MNIALVHDDFVQQGGAERLFEEISKIFPNAPIFTSQVDWFKVPKSIKASRFNTSFIQKIPYAKNFYKFLLPLYPIAFESLDFAAFDVVISSTTRFAKGVITRPNAIHIAYVNSTPRFLWEKDKFKDYLPSIVAFAIKPVLQWLARWDKISSSRVDFFIANSKNVQSKIKKTYGRESLVVYPFADTEFFKPPASKASRNYYLVVSRLNKWKKIEIAIGAISENEKLVIVGTGPQKSNLQSKADTNISFIEKVSNEDLRDLYQNAQALIVTQDEDFGIASVEAQACGTPIIAYSSGGVLETVIANKTGIFFKSQTAESLKDAIQRAAIVKWDHDLCRVNALKFSKANFKRNLLNFVNNVKKHK